ncbi:LytR family transcriptional attenuator [Nocardioides albertanoniae]|uniref:LytR family transcriptional attenuator n=1 Tax=Nocardioides albertanoniae TaxID=1175486 RepID=A0A543AA55_9ACTN|nr:LCP family protein [Nocardioides albertanoniae]TQL69483.1 LytR family transcriptional attenuator [Nocardioides albertanoniae]
MRSKTWSGTRTVAVTVAVTMLILAAGTGIATWAFYGHLNRNLDTSGDIQHLLDGADDNDDGPRRPLNILILGTDGRDCKGCSIDGESGAGGSDSTILLHVAADRKSAYGVSIPRDAIVDRPECTTEDGKKIDEAKDVMWNQAYALGGPICTARQTELLTGVPFDHYIALDFAGFRGMVDAVGGVTVCIPEAIDDKEHNIFLPAGTHNLRGKQALDYVRNRSSTPNADLGRMRRQQYFLTTLSTKVLSADTLTRPRRLAKFAAELSKSISTDIGSVSGLAELAAQMREIKPTGVEFVTVPNAGFPTGDPNWGRLRILPESDQLWQRMLDDRPLHDPRDPAPSSASPTTPANPGSASAAPGPTGSGSSAGPGSEAAPSDVPADAMSPEEKDKDAADNGLCAPA